MSVYYQDAPTVGAVEEDFSELTTFRQFDYFDHLGSRL
jgi:hypothetical protein